MPIEVRSQAGTSVTATRAPDRRIPEFLEPGFGCSGGRLVRDPARSKGVPLYRDRNPAMASV